MHTPYFPFYAAELLSQWGRGGDRVVDASSDHTQLSTYAARLSNGNIALVCEQAFFR